MLVSDNRISLYCEYYIRATRWDFEIFCINQRSKSLSWKSVCYSLQQRSYTIICWHHSI